MGVGMLETLGLMGLLDIPLNPANMIVLPLTLPAANSQILGWNNLGMHCMDADFSVFAILPP